MPVTDIEADIQDAAKALNAEDFLNGVRPADADDDADDAALVSQESETTGAAKPQDADDGAATDDAGDEIEPPNEWTAAEQEAFRKLPKEGRETFIGFHRRVSEERERLNDEASRWRQTYEPIDQLLAPVRDAIRTNGMTEAQYVASLHHAGQWLARDPAGFLRHMAATKGVDLRQLAGPDPQAAAEEEYVDPAVRAVEQRLMAEIQRRDEAIQRLSGGFRGWQQQAEQAEQAQVDGAIAEFASAADEAGKPLRPYFNEVKYDMGVMMTAAQQRGQFLTLEDAYERAVRANPETWAKLQSAQQAADRRRAEQDARERSEKARRAGSSVVGEGAGVSMQPEIPTATALDTALAVARARGWQV